MKRARDEAARQFRRDPIVVIVGILAAIGLVGMLAFVMDNDEEEAIAFGVLFVVAAIALIVVYIRRTGSGGSPPGA